MENEKQDITEQIDLLGFFTSPVFEIDRCAYVDIDLNYANISIEQLMPSASDRGRYKVLATHKLEFADKCYIDFCDGFPRYYFDFDCMLEELKSWLECRENLEIKDVLVTARDKTTSIMPALNPALNQEKESGGE